MTSVECFLKKNCRICNSSSLEKVVQLTPSPPGNNFLQEEQISNLSEEEFPLEYSNVTFSSLSYTEGLCINLFHKYYPQ